MNPYEKKSFLKKKVSNERKKNSEKISKSNIQLIHQILNTINVSLLVLIFTLFFLSLDSQRKWSNIYKTLSKTKAMNYNLNEYISKTEEFYIGELESLNTYRKTKPKDLIYLDRTAEKKESFLKKNFRIFIKGLNDSKYQRGY
ncbi:hypothetical protein N9V09_02660 [Prochlorococcus sp. AH-736-K20]|nr:hypothetical protein [Prochlorococcus sp. AH-736-K20]MDA9746300.1 hypothetical protein [Prochlorococcus sp. AH-736-K20]